MNAPFPFIVGCGRSGSTLLRSMLDAHPDMVVPGESYFLEQLIGRRDGFMRQGEFLLEDLVEELRADTRFRTWEVDQDRVQADLRAAAPPDLSEAIRAVYRSVAAAGGATRWADKTPAYALSAIDLAAVLPEAVFVHLIRDPRDVAASYRSASWGPRSLVSAAQMWTNRAGAAHAAGQRLGPDRYLALYYEALVADPERELRRLCDFIDLPFEGTMLEYEQSEAARSTSHRDGGAHAALLQRPTVGIRDWRTELSAAEASRVGAITGDLAAEFGYEPSDPLSAHDRARFLAERGVAVAESMSLRFRRTRTANRLRGPWRAVRGRATIEDVLGEQR